MLHCNMKLVWQSSYAWTDSETFQSCGVINLDRRNCGGERRQPTDEIARSRHREMRQQRGAIGPLLDEHQPQRILAIDMHGVGDASRLFARAMHVLQTKSLDLVEGIFSGGHTAGHYDHGVPLAYSIAKLMELNRRRLQNLSAAAASA